MSSATPGGPGHRLIEKGDLVLIDIPTCVEGYHADQTRMYVAGRPAASEVDLFGRLREVADHVIAHLRPGLSTGEVFALAEEHAAVLGIAEGFMALEPGLRSHFVGHSLGLEVNEPPLLARNGDRLLRANMVLAIELHISDPSGPVLKLEDTVLLGANGARLLTYSPRELNEVSP